VTPTPTDVITQQSDPVVDGVAIEDASALANQVWQTLEAESGSLSLPGLKVQPLADFLHAAEPQKMASEEKRVILDQAVLMFQHLYPHLAFKKQLFGDFSDPGENLTAISAGLDTIGETDFHSRVSAAFGVVMDPHTWYGWPAPYRGAVAFLPFQLGFWMDRDRTTHFVVTKVMNATSDGGLGHPSFGLGAEILRWNLEEIQCALSRQALERLPVPWGETKLTHWTGSATVVPLRFCLPPDDGLATLHYIPAGGGETHAIRLPWGVATGMGDHTGFPRGAFSVNVPTVSVSSAARHFVREGRLLVEVAPSIDPQRESSIPEVFQFQHTGGDPQPDGLDPAALLSGSKPGARFGYLRIRQFAASGPLNSADDLVHEFRRILQDVMNPMAPDGLILDIRGNPGGDIQAAERMLQMLTASRIHPVQFHLVNTPAVQNILQILRSQSRNPAGLTPEQSEKLTDAQLRLQPWMDDPPTSATDSDPLTAGHPLTPEDKANEIGQVYRGPCVLLTDGWSYSSADIFAAGFQDHAIGPIIGMDATTGGGGANVWSHDELLATLPSLPDLAIVPLPPLAQPLEERATMSLAFLRCLRAAGPHAGQAIEDYGVSADLWASPGSAEHLLAGFPGVVGIACELMAASRGFAVRARSAPQFAGGTIRVELQTTNIDSLTFLLDNLGVLSTAVGDTSPQSFSVPVPASNPHPSRLTVLGSVAFPSASGADYVMAASVTFDLASAGSSASP
jgi:hypothetical protein